MTRSSLLKILGTSAAAILLSGIALAPAGAKAPHISMSLDFEPSTSEPAAAPQPAPEKSPAPRASVAAELAPALPRACC